MAAIVPFKERQDTAEAWSQNNPIPLQGQICVEWSRGFETDPDTGEPVEVDVCAWKVGDGIRNYNDLPYVTGQAGPRGLDGPEGPQGIRGEQGPEGPPGSVPITDFPTANNSGIAFSSAGAYALLQRILNIEQTGATNADITEVLQLVAAAQARADEAYALASQASGDPIGTIKIWSRAIEEIPAGWVICDGTNGTPDLRNLVIKGYDPAGAGMNATGGSATHSHGASATNTSLTVAQLAAHTHPGGSSGYAPVEVRAAPSGGMQYRAPRQGTGSNVTWTQSKTQSQNAIQDIAWTMPSGGYGWTTRPGATGTEIPALMVDWFYAQGGVADSNPLGQQRYSAFSATIPSSVIDGPTGDWRGYVARVNLSGMTGGSAGGNQGHTHNVTIENANNESPYRVLAYIMRIA